MKRKIALFMSLVLALGMFMPELEGLNIFGADQIWLTVDFDTTLNNGTLTTVPVHDGKPASNSHILFKWDFDERINNGTGVYVLSYFIDNNKRIEFAVQNDYGKAMATYKQYRYSSDGSFDIVSGSGIRYRLYNNNIATQYQYIEDYSRPLREGNNEIVIEEIVGGTAVPLEHPRFVFERNFGYSIQYDGLDIRFLLRDGELLYMTSGMDGGRIYDVNLDYFETLADYNSEAGNVVKTKSLSNSNIAVITGIDRNSYQMIPTGNGDGTTANTTNEFINTRYNSDLASNSAISLTPLDMTTSETKATNSPGQERLGMIFRFSIPKKLDDSYQYTEIPDSTEIGLSTTIRLLHENNSHIYNISVRSIYDPVDRTTTVSDPRLSIREFEIVNDSLHIWVDGFESGLLFSDTEISFNAPEQMANGTRIRVRNHVLMGFATSYTFIRYDIRTSGENYFLRFDPYSGVSGYYYLYSQELFFEDTPDRDLESIGADNFDAQSWSNGSSEMIFPLMQTTTTISTYYYFLLFRPLVITNQVFSQKVEFKTDHDDVSISLPNNFSVLNYDLTPKDDVDLYGSEGNLNMTLRWNVASEKILEKLLPISDPDKTLSIVYALNSTLQPNVQNGAVDEFANVEIRITRYDSDKHDIDNPNDAKYVYNLVITYLDHPSDSDKNTTITTEEGLLMQSSTMYYIVPELMGMLAKRKDSGNLTEPITYFFYPNVYFLNLQVAAVDGMENDSEAATVHTSITLDDITEVSLPPPENVAVDSDNLVTTSRVLGDDKNEVSGELTFRLPGNAVRDYLDMSFSNLAERFGNTSPSSPTDVLEFDMSFNIYISTDQQKLAQLSRASKDNNDLRTVRRTSSSVVSYKDNQHEEDDKATLYFAKLDSSDPDAIKINGEDAINALRAGEIIMIEGIEISDEDIDDMVLYGDSVVPPIFKLKGLDKNQPYYVSVDFWLDNNLDRPQESPLSAVVAFTTIADRLGVGEEEKQPPAPEFTYKEGGIDRNIISWNRVPETITDTSTGIQDVVEYELVRIKSEQIEDQEALSIVDDFKEFWAKTPANAPKKGFRTSGYEVTYYNPSVTPPWNSMEREKDYDYSITTSTVTLTDVGVQPNQVYFYYARTVRTTTGSRTVNGVDEPFSVTKYSSWSQVSVTTSNLEAPVNLTVDRSDRTAYDDKTEAILSFEAPISDWEDSLGVEYDIQYVIKEGNGEWSNPITIPAAALKEQAVKSPTLDGYTHFRYKITDLIPNTGYSFMVRIIDKNGDVSMYSNIAETRTSLDQPDYDFEKELEQWEDYLDEKMMDLFKHHYWYANDTSSKVIAVYRPTMFDSLLAETVSGNIILTSGTENADVMTYYLPATAILSANAQNKGFTLVNGSIDITLSPNAFDPNTNVVMQSLIRNVNDGNIADYYVRIDVTYSNTDTIDGKTAATPIAAISFEAVGANMTNLKWDNTILALLTEKIKSDGVIGEVTDEIGYMIKNESVTGDIIKYVNEYVEKVRVEFSDTINDKLYDALDSSLEMTTLNSSMIISYQPGDITETVSGYSYVNNIWVVSDTVQFGDKKAIFANTSGSYVFTRSALNLMGLDTIAGSYGLTGLITKYGLDDFLGKGSAFEIDSNATGYMVAGIASRITGATKGTDPFAYLTSKDITVSTRNQYANISNQEAIHIMMFIYEQKTNTQISSITVRNYGLTSNITGLDDKYKKSVQVAFELDLYRNSAMLPKSPMSVRELLEFLKNLNNKVKL